MLMSLRHLLLPEAFQGGNAKPPYFEGWYFCFRNGGEAVAVLPGVCLGPDSHAFIQWLDARAGRFVYERFPLSAFRYSLGRFRVKVGQNVFSQDGVHLRLPELTGDLRFRSRVPFSRSGPHTGEMGPTAFLPGLQCRHGVVNTTGELSGSLQSGRHAIPFDGGRGYVEKDWGSAFPHAYLWTQAHFGEVSFMLSLADIPLPGGSATGALAFLYGPGLRRRFATYSGFFLKAICTSADGAWHLEFASPCQRLYLRLRTQNGLPLRAPSEHGMDRVIREDLFASLRVRLVSASGRTLFAGQSEEAGAELVGDLSSLRPG